MSHLFESTARGSALSDAPSRLGGPGGVLQRATRPELLYCHPRLVTLPSLLPGSIDVQELHIGILLTYDKLNNVRTRGRPRRGRTQASCSAGMPRG